MPPKKTAKKKPRAPARKAAKKKPAKKPAPTTGLSQRGYAAHRKKKGLPGHTLWAVQKALKAGRITRNAEGKIEPKQADKDWLENTEDQAPPPGQGELFTEGYHKSRARHEEAKAQLAELLVKEKKGELVPREVVAQAYADEFRAASEKLQTLSARISHTLATTRSARKCQQILDEAHFKVLEELAAGSPEEIEEVDD